MRAPAPSSDTASRILDVAERLVQTQGFNGFSYADVSAALGITKASLHYHFATKADLGLRLIGRYHETFLEALQNIAGERGARQRLRRYARLYADVLRAERMCLCGMLAADYATLSRPMRAAVTAFFDANERFAGPFRRVVNLPDDVDPTLGIAFDSKGRLISVQTTPGNTKIGVIYPKGSEAVLTDNFEGKQFGRPNDLVVDKKGGVYFSEPGPNATPGQPPPTPPLSPAVYYVPPGGKSIRIAEGIERPNGIQLSPDEKTLYVNNTNGEYVLAFDVKPDGTVGNRRNFAKYPSVATPAAGGFNSGADGLAIDGSGRVYVVSTGGVHVFSPKGDLLGTIPLSLAGQNIAFAGPDKKTLYIVGRGSAFKVRLLAEGNKGRAK
jgi:gluconolactonase